MGSEVPRRKVILDVDTGVDDAFALAFAALNDAVDCVGVTCVDGNVDVDLVVSNTLTVLDLAGAVSVPVSRGAERPLLNHPMYATEYHGQDGLGDVGIDRSDRAPESRHAVEWMYSILRAFPGEITIVALAPLTNLALLLRMHPDAESLIERIVVMGGAQGAGNASPVAEFNVWHDPDAAAIVFGSDAPLTMYGLEVYEQVRVSRAHADALAGVGTPVALMAERLIRQQFDVLVAMGDHSDSVTLGDYGALATLLFPDRAVTKPCLVAVSTEYGPTRGQTVFVDDAASDAVWPHELLNQARLIDVVEAVDGEHYAALWLEALGLSATRG